MLASNQQARGSMQDAVRVRTKECLYLLSDSMQKQCLKCQHVNTEWGGSDAEACPQCGAYYGKVEAALRAREDAIRIATEEAITAQTSAAASAAPQTQNAQDSKANSSATGVIALIVGGLWFFSGSDSSEGPKIDGVSAQIACENHGRRILKAPTTAEFAPYHELLISGSGNGPYEVIGYVDAQNSFGATLRNRYSCTVEFADGRSRVANFLLL